MRNFILVLTVFVLAITLSGLLIGVDSPGWRGKLLPLGMFLFAFVWMPTFLFYSYDRKQLRKRDENQSINEEDPLP